MIYNPEFRKNIQLHLNPAKLVMMPIVLGMIFFAIYLYNTHSNQHHWYQVDTRAYIANIMQIYSLTLFGILVFIWGTKMAVDSLIGEFNDKTWDSQRMTAIGPWNLVWGKLFGGTLFSWYGGVICLLVFATSAMFNPQWQRSIIVRFCWLLSATTQCLTIWPLFSTNKSLAY
ncbi:hypothetical protein TI03_06390 [Achromatium sp. WMS1]|nr:hypothetical protein TI03_06390 [Achromatium sp. WMS1]